MTYDGLAICVTKSPIAMLFAVKDYKNKLHFDMVAGYL